MTQPQPPPEAASDAGRPHRFEGSTPAKRRQEQLRLRVFEEAALLFEENGGEENGGFDRTTVEAIAARSDISVRTFFRYFESKTDVIYLDLRRSLDDYVALLSERLADGREPLTAAISVRVEQVTAFVAVPGNEQRLRRAFRSSTFKERYAVWLTVWDRRVSDVLRPYLEGRATPELQADIIASLAIRTGSIALSRWASGPPGASVLDDLSSSYSALVEMASKVSPADFAPKQSAAKGLNDEARKGAKTRKVA